MRFLYFALLTGPALFVDAQVVPRENLQAIMQKTATDLGVTCNYCHSAERGSGAPEPKKDIARQMFVMTNELSAKVQTATGNAKAKVECVTCHRGVPIPRQIGDIFTQTMVEKSLPDAIAQHKDLREHFFGRQAYDFGEDSLLSLGQRITASRPDDAIAILKLNLDFYPKSAKTLAAIGYAYTRKYDDESAIKYLEQAVEIEPNNGIINGQLVQLKTFRRKK